MITYSYHLHRQTRAVVDPEAESSVSAENEVHHLISAWTRTFLYGEWMLTDFRRNGQPAELKVNLTKSDTYAWEFEMRVDGLLIALFDVYRSDMSSGRIRVRSAPCGAPYALKDPGLLVEQPYPPVGAEPR
jgi:hypothetical protein